MMTKSRWLCLVVVMVLALTGSFVPSTGWAQAQVVVTPPPPQAPSSSSVLITDDPGRSRFVAELPVSQTTENHRVGAVFLNILHVPGKAILCGTGAVLSTFIMLATFGDAYELATKTFEEGCLGTWVLKPEHVSGQIQRPPDL